MKNVIGIRKETKDELEMRAPLAPGQVKQLVEEHGIKVLVQPAKQRKFTDEEYKNAGAILTDDLTDSNIIFGVKETPIENLIENKPFVFFSHTIKGQSYNMPMLKEILNKNISLLDYELVTDEKGRRLIFFGRYAGYVGMIDSLWILGQRLKTEGYYTPFEKIKQAVEYDSLEEAKKSIEQVGDEIREKGLPEELTPFVTAFTGAGNVSKGAQSIFELLPSEKIKPGEFLDFMEKKNFSNKVLYYVEYDASDIYDRKDGELFDMTIEGHFERFLKNPHDYKSKFEKFLPYFTLLINGIFWTPEYDRLVTKEFVQRQYREGNKLPLRVIGDITCDIGGSIELNQKATRYDNPCYVFDVETGKIIDGWEGNGPVILAVDKLPTELPRESSTSFGAALLPFVPALASADFTADFDKLEIPEEFKKALIAHKGKLTPNFEYLYEYLNNTD